MRNWKEEIVNYHQCRWTNATVEGRHNRIKAFQRRHYFTRNRTRYKTIDRQMGVCYILNKRLI
nr:transposase [Paenibacillus caui]